MLWSHIGILSRLLAAQPRSTTGPLFLSVSLQNDPTDSVFDGVGLVGFKKNRPMLFYWPKLLDPFLSSTVFFHFSSFCL